MLLEANDAGEHERRLECDELPRLWAELYLPRNVRAAWQDAHPVLPGGIGAGTNVPQL